MHIRLGRCASAGTLLNNRAIRGLCLRDTTNRSSSLVQTFSLGRFTGSSLQFCSTTERCARAVRAEDSAPPNPKNGGPPSSGEQPALFCRQHGTGAYHQYSTPTPRTKSRREMTSVSDLKRDHNYALGRVPDQPCSCMGLSSPRPPLRLQASKFRTEGLGDWLFLRRWPVSGGNITVPYQITATNVNTISRAGAAIGHWEANACVDFVPYNNLVHTDYIDVWRPHPPCPPDPCHN